MKNMIVYLGTFLVLLAIMTFIGYQKEIKKVEAAQLKAMQDSIATSDSLAKADSLRNLGVDSTIVSESNTLLAEEESQDLGNPSSGYAEETPETPEKDYKDVAAIYDKMNPAEAAKILNNFSPEEAAAILSHMKKRQAAKVISSLEPALAAQISQLMLEK